MKAVYEVRVEVDNEVAAEYLIWLREHLKQIVEAVGFEKADLFTLEHESPRFATWVVQYVASSRVTIEDYLNHHSKSFRGDAIHRFGGKFKIERRILNFQESFPA